MHSLKIIYKLVNKHLMSIFITLNMTKNYWINSNSLNCTHHQNVWQFSANIINVIHSSLNKYDQTHFKLVLNKH